MDGLGRRQESTPPRRVRDKKHFIIILFASLEFLLWFGFCPLPSLEVQVATGGFRQ